MIQRVICNKISLLHYNKKITNSPNVFKCETLIDSYMKLRHDSWKDIQITKDIV
jgi:hypothetical protein